MLVLMRTMDYSKRSGRMMRHRGLPPSLNFGG